MSSFEEAYELTGHGTFNYLALFTNGIILLYVTLECLGLGYVLNKAECDIKINTEDRGTISAATFIGIVTPAIAWGYLADTYGRRRVMLPASVLSVVCSVLSSLSVDYWSMLLLRLLTGTMASASCATAYVYLGELTSPSMRAASIANGSAFIAGGYFVMPGFAWILLPLNFNVHLIGRLNIVSWRILMCSYTLWGAASCVGLYILPESPSFMLATKGAPATLKVLAKIYACNKRAKAEEYPVTELVAHPVCRKSFMETLRHLRFLVKPPLLKCVLISHLCNFMVYMQSNAFYVWMPHIVDELLKYTPTHPHRNLCQTMTEVHETVNVESKECLIAVDPLVYPIMMAVFIPTVAVFLGIGFGMKRWRKTIIYSAIIGTCAVCLLLASFVPSTTAAIVFYVPGVCGIAANTVLAAAVVEAFPTSLRALTMCTLFMVGRLGSAVGMRILAWGLMHSCTAIVLLINVLAFASGGLLCLWPNNEKTRATLEAQDFTY